MKKMLIALMSTILLLSLCGCTEHVHNYVSEMIEEADCSKSGSIVYTCECGDTYTKTVDPTETHEWNDGAITIESSCMTSGIMTYTCAVCGMTKEETVPAIGNHSWGEAVTTKDATCLEVGETSKTCGVCGETEITVISKTESHIWSDGSTTKKATCADNGIVTYTCSICNSTKTETVPATNEHSWDNGKTTKEATCAVKGEFTYTCLTCKITKVEEIALAQTHKWDNGKVTKQETCSTDGVRTYTCSDCKTVKTETINKTGKHIWDSGSETEKATCGKDGKRTYTCSDCATVKTEVISKTGNHTWDSGTVTLEATCSQDGKYTYTCSVCETVRTETIAKTGKHVWDHGETTKEPTCKDKGTKIFSCTGCNAKKRTTLEKTEEHKYDTSIVKKNATCISKGLKEKTCSVCNTTISEAIEISQDHLWNNGKITNRPTEKADGEKSFSCILCNATKTEIVSKLNNHSHSWDSGVDTVFATKISKGIKTYTCETCGEIKEESIAAKGTESVWRQDVYYNFTVDKRVTNDGNFSICISSSEKNVISLDNEIRLKPKTSYIISMDIKTQNVVNHESREHDAFIFVTSGKNISFSSSVTGTTDWKTVYIPVKTDSLGKITLSLALGYWNNACTGQAWFDNFQAIEIAEIETRDPIWNCLFIIQTNVSFKTFNEDTEESINISHKMSDDEYKAICKSIDDFKNDLNEKAAGTVKVTTKIIKADTEFSDYDKIGYNSYYASDRAALEYFKKNKINIDGYDHVFLVNSFPELPRDYFALGGTFINGLVAMSYILYGDGATNCLEYCYNITETNWPAGLFLHEFLHGVESYGNAIGYPVPSPDGSGTYGYPDVDGWRTFYMDIVNNNVKKNSSYVGGVHPLVWRLPPSMFN